MNNKLLLIQGITLLYRESQLADLRENSAQLVKSIIASIKMPELSLGIDHDKDILNGLKATALHLCETPVGYRFEASELMQRLRVNCSDDSDLFDAIYEGVGKDLPEEEIKLATINLRHSLNDYVKEQTFAKTLERFAQQYRFNRTSIKSIQDFANEMASAMEPFQGYSGEQDPAIISDVSSDRPGDMARVYKDVQANNGGGFAMVSGWQGLNRMLTGNPFGASIKRGALITCAALQHNFKTGFSLALFASLALFNTPQMINPLRKPLLVHVSFEDDHDLTFNYLYKMLKENETGEDASTSDLTPEQIEIYVRTRLEARGYHTRFLRVNPTMWSYRDVQDQILKMENEGYEVHCCCLDYLLKLPTTGCDGNAAGEALRNLFERMRNFMSARKITLITPHQLSTDAKNLARLGESDFVKGLVGMGYYAGSKQLDQVIDVELFLHIEKVNRIYYLTLQRGKQRGRMGSPPENELYLAWQFGYNCIPFDFEKADSTRKKPGAGVIGSRDEVAFWDTADAFTSS